MAAKALPSPDELRKILDYDPETGVLTWKPRSIDAFSKGGSGAEANAARWNAIYAARQALTSDNGRGYRRGAVFGRFHLAHRVAWAIHYGRWPSDQIDHINGDRADNRIANLRAVTNAENSRNMKRSAANTSGVAGVCWHKRRGKWAAYITVCGRNINIGDFSDFDVAVAARKAAEAKYGFHPGHGRG